MIAPQKDFLRQPEWFAAMLITLAIGWMHIFFLLHAGGLWRDEVNLVNLASRHGVSDMAKDAFPVLMPLLLKSWVGMGWGPNDFTLRILGTMVGLGIVAAFWMVALRTRRPPLFSLTLFGLNATVIFYGDSLRAYGLGCLLIVLTTAAMLSFLKTPSWFRASIMAVTAILSVQTLYQNTVIFGAICFGAWIICWNQKNLKAAVKIFAAAVIAAMSLLPYWHNIFGLSGSGEPLRVGFQPSMALANFSQLTAYPLPQFTIVWELLVYILIGFSLVELRAQLSNSNPTREKPPAINLQLFATATMLAAFVGFISFLWFAGRRTEPWYFLPLAVILATGFDMGIPLLSLPKWIRATILTAVLATAFTGITMAQRSLNQRFTNVDELAKQLNAQAFPEDFVLVTPWFCGISFERYCRSNLTWQTLPPITDHSVHRYDLLSAEMKNPAALEPLFHQMAATLESGHRVWIISLSNVGEIKIPDARQPPPPALPPPPLPNSGWAEWPYCANWAAQTAWFLKHNCVEFAQVETAGAKNNVSLYEHMSLFMASGWTNQPTNALTFPSR